MTIRALSAAVLAAAMLGCGATGQTSPDGGQTESDAGQSAPDAGSVTVEGFVASFRSAQPVTTTVSLLDQPTVTTMTAAVDGTFRLGPFTPSATAVLVAAPTSQHWGTLVGLDLGTAAVHQVGRIEQFPTVFFDMQQQLLAQQGAVMQDPNQAVVVVRILESDALASGPVTVRMSPTPTVGTMFAFGQNGVPALNQEQIESQASPVAVFYNLPTTSAGSISITAMHPVRTCTVRRARLPTLGGHVTVFDVSCPAP